MPRPRKCRRVCRMPRCTQFGPVAGRGEREVSMTVDEYETVRLIDLEGLTQEECARQMDVARTTVQSIYAAARRKLAECIVGGIRLDIAGGDVQLCEAGGQGCTGCCRGRRCEQEGASTAIDNTNETGEREQ